MIWLTSLFSNGHFSARRPNRLIAFRHLPLLRVSFSCLSSSLSCVSQPLSPSHKRCEVCSLPPFRLSRSCRAPSRVTFSVLSSYNKRCISLLALLTAREYSKQSDATFADSSITAMTFAANPSPSIVSRCGLEDGRQMIEDGMIWFRRINEAAAL